MGWTPVHSPDSGSALKSFREDWVIGMEWLSNWRIQLFAELARDGSPGGAHHHIPINRRGAAGAMQPSARVAAELVIGKWTSPRSGEN
jgi:hypothetical protein